MNRLRVGIIGVGNISTIYLKNLTGRYADRVELLGCADLLAERAGKAQAEYSLPRSYGTPEALLDDPDVELVLNLTIPRAHYSICRAAIDAGKHAYVEKPLTVELAEGESLVSAAAGRGVRLGGAPDTFLGGGIQTCRKLIDEGAIGEPVAATAFMAIHGHESWHPDPEFYYKRGGGPMFDMGPYYLTALVNLVGPIRSVTGSARASFATRTITSEPRRGTEITVDVPTHIAGIVDFASGAIGTIVMSFDVRSHHLPRIEIYGTEGSLAVPDPNTFGGAPLLRLRGDKEWREVPLTHGNADNCRGLGVAELADAVAAGRPHRASAELTGHVLEAMHGFHIASDSGRRYDMKTKGIRPEAMPASFSGQRLSALTSPAAR